MYGICVCGHGEEYHEIRELGIKDTAIVKRTFCQQTSWCWCIEYEEPKRITYKKGK